MLTDPPSIDADHVQRQMEWSQRTFGPGPRYAGVIDHLKKELKEVEDDPDDLSEWVDVIILGFDGAWQTGAGPQAIIDAIIAKQRVNEERTWPDWRTAPKGKAIEHDRTGEALFQCCHNPRRCGSTACDEYRDGVETVHTSSFVHINTNGLS